MEQFVTVVPLGACPRSKDPPAEPEAFGCWPLKGPVRKPVKNKQPAETTVDLLSSLRTASDAGTNALRT